MRAIEDRAEVWPNANTPRAADGPATEMTVKGTTHDHSC
jgi:hypothetical protein